jgi:transcriptional regulator with XRE-family HTH domain
MVKLAKLMETKEITDAELARRIGCGQSTVFHWRTGAYLPRADYVKKICETLDYSADDLLGVERAKTDRLNRGLALELFQAVTKRGKYDSEMLHQMATQMRKARGGKITEMELWFREMAEALYLIEITQKKQTSTNQNTYQLQLLDI